MSKVEKELLNKKMTFYELDDFMVENGYYSIFFEGVIKDLKKYSSIIYEEEQKEE